MDSPANVVDKFKSFAKSSKEYFTGLARRATNRSRGNPVCLFLLSLLEDFFCFFEDWEILDAFGSFLSLKFGNSVFLFIVLG